MSLSSFDFIKAVVENNILSFLSSILIDIENEGWKFTSQGYTINIETGLYFGKKNSFTENQNLFISGITQNEDQIIKWEFEKIT